MYGLGLRLRSTRYTSIGSAVASCSKRCEMTTWKTSPSRMYCFDRSTAARKSASLGAVRRRRRRGEVDLGEPRLGRAGRAVAASGRGAPARRPRGPRASSSPSLSADAMSCTVPVRWSMTTSSETKRERLSRHPRSRRAAGCGRCSIWRTASQPMKPTSPPVSGGCPATSSVRQRSKRCLEGGERRAVGAASPSARSADSP